LKIHTRTHTQERPYKCPHKDCVKAFKTSGQMNEHKKTHINERYILYYYRPFECNVCQKKFTRKSNMKSHVETLHSKMNKIECESCNEKFSTKGNLGQHVERKVKYILIKAW